MSELEKQLIEQAKAGDHNAFEQLYPLIYKKAYLYAYQIAKNEADAHDAAQETMIQIHRSIKDLQDTSNFYAWMKRIVVSKCNRIFRKNKMVYMPHEVLQELPMIEEKRNYLIPGKGLFNQEEKEILLTLMKQLNKNIYDVLYRMYFQNMKLQEIADDLQIPLGTVKTRAKRGRKFLKELIEEYEQKENRKLYFYLPGTMVGSCGLLWLVALRNNIKKKLVHSSFQYQLLQIGCICSFAILTTIGIQEIVKHPDITNYVNFNQNEDTDLFASFKYKQEWINSYKDAYYACLKFAYNEEKFQMKSQYELQEIYPVYQVLKEEQGVYWNLLEKYQWQSSYESFLKNNKN